MTNDETIRRLADLTEAMTAATVKVAATSSCPPREVLSAMVMACMGWAATHDIPIEDYMQLQKILIEGLIRRGGTVRRPRRK